MSEDYSIGYARGYEAGQQSILKLAEQPAQQEPKAKAIAECLAVLRPTVRGKFPQEQALEELAGYVHPQAREPEQPAPVKCWKCGDADPAFTDVCQVPACGMREKP